jgi:hypothetical protein
VPTVSLGLRIGGLGIDLSPVTEELVSALQRSRAQAEATFVGPPVPPAFMLGPRSGDAAGAGDVRLELAWLDDARPPFGSQLAFTSPNWRAYHRADGGYDLEINWADGVPGLYRYVEIFGEPAATGRAPSTYHGRLSCVRGAGMDRLLDYPTDEVLYLHLLAPRGGLIVHGCALADRGTGLVFAGSSGAGKTTLSRRWQHEAGVELLTDERCVIRCATDGDGAEVYGSPWAGEGCVARDGQAPLGALFFLRQDTVDRWRALRPSDAIARLLACAFPPLWDGLAAATAVSVATRIVTRVRCYELGFLRQCSVVPMIREALPELVA